MANFTPLTTFSGISSSWTSCNHLSFWSNLKLSLFSNSVEPAGLSSAAGTPRFPIQAILLPILLLLIFVWDSPRFPIQALPILLLLIFVWDYPRFPIQSLLLPTLLLLKCLWDSPRIPIQSILLPIILLLIIVWDSQPLLLPNPLLLLVCV